MKAVRPVRPPWKSGVVLVCKKCSGNDTLDLGDWLKERLKRDGLRDEVKVLRVGCMDLCPKPKEERDDLYRHVLALLDRPPPEG
jgi:hypothetical protein